MHKKIQTLHMLFNKNTKVIKKSKLFDTTYYLQTYHNYKNSISEIRRLYVCLSLGLNVISEESINREEHSGLLLLLIK